MNKELSQKIRQNSLILQKTILNVVYKTGQKSTGES